MTMNTRVHIAKPVAAERLFLHILGILERDPGFKPHWERSPDEQKNDPFGPTEPGPLMLGRASYKHARKGEPIFRADGTPFCHAQTGEQFTERQSEYRTILGQGLACIWEVTYGSDGPLRWPHDEDECEGDGCCSDYGDTADALPVHMVSCNFDTAYGYRADNGAGCADLHAFLIYEIGRWLEGEGLSTNEWSWNHEEKGTWHRPEEVHLRGNVALGAGIFGLSGAVEA